MKSDFNPEACKTYVNEKFESSCYSSLFDYIKIKNLSRAYDPEWATNGLLEQAADHIKNWVQGFDIKGLVTTEVIKDEGYTPLVYTEIAGDIKDFTILFYGHFDKQPYNQADWDAPKHPFKPYRDDKDRLYGRGGADDGYSTYSSMLAVKAVQEQGVPIPRIVMLTQGDEESGNHIDHYIETLKDRIGTPNIVFCLDSGSLDYDHLFITKSLRGYIGGTLKAQVLQNGVHSGDISGVCPSAYRVANMMINRLENVQTGVVNSAFNVNVPENRYSECYNLVQQLGQSAIKDYPYFQNTQSVSENTFEVFMNRGWKPQLTVVGFNGFPAIEEAGNVSHPWVEAKLSLRVPPTLDVNVKQQEFQTLLTENPPYQSTVTMSNVNYGNGWNCPDYEEWVENAFKEAGQLYFNRKTESHCEGGSIPLMGLLSSIWPNAQFVVTGVLGPDSNAHGPNEFLDIPYCKKLTQSMAHVVSKVSENTGQKCKK